MLVSTRAARGLLAAVAVAATAIAGAAQLASQGPPQPYTKWNQYGGSSDSMQYSALAQINKSNVKQLERAWFYHVPGDPERIVFNPLIVDNVMYVRGADGVIVALEATTGKPLWMSTVRATERGLAYWESKDRSDRRLLVTANNGIRAVDARTGRQIMTFGNNGFVDMRAGFPRRNGGPSNSPGRIFENLLIVGSNTGELYGSPAGDIRAYDVLTGKLVWTFHTIPRPGEYGYETWPETAFRYVGGANVWGDITVDEKNGIVFLPTGSPTYDLYGGDRQGDNLFGNCLLALDARTGKRLWHFQIVHHDVWDYDNTSPPKLLTVQHNGKPIDIVAQAGKTGFLYVFERKTGKPLWPIQERPVPKSNVPGEFSSPTQPFPTKPPPFARQSMRPEDVTPFVSADEQEKLKQLVREAANDGVFTPPNHERFAIQFPGAWGGANFASAAGDPATGMAYIRSYEQISYRKMSPVDPNLGGPDSSDARGRGGAPPLGAREQEGQGVYMKNCASCHGPGQMPIRSLKAIGQEQFRSIVRRGMPPMPAFPESRMSDDAFDALERFLMALPTTDEQAGNPSEIRLPQNPGRYQGPPVRYAGSSFAAGWYASNTYPVAGPPWSQLTAYDLNEGTIKWRIADGAPPALAAKGITNTGTMRPRNGPVVTAGGLVFLANTQDGFLRAFDKDTGALVWEHETDGNPEGIPAVYEVNGRQYVAFAVSAWVGTEQELKRTDALQRKFGKVEAQGYHVFALPHARQSVDAAQGKPQPYTKWDQYGGSSDSMQYSALAHINTSNVKQLERAWFYPVPGEPDRLVFNPLIVDNVMYVTGVRGVIVALDATTGKELWMSTIRGTERGLAYWESKDRSDRRLIVTANNGIRQLDARTGQQILTFGNNGFVDMRVGVPRRNGGPNNSPGRVFENLIIVGSNVGEGYGSPPGDIRAYDILTGKLVWTFHTIPRPGEFGYETWPEDAFRYAGGANTWGDLTLDEKNGIIFLPTGSPTHDLYGGDRRGDNLFGNCLLALDARTGKRLWHFQIVHHDLWDYDNAAAPQLLTVQHNGKPIEIVAQAGKTGFLYVFERKTGKPLWPIEERPVPKSDVPGEFSSPTQPIPTKPPPFARQSMTPEEVNPFVSPEEQEKLKQLVREAANEGVFTPSSHLRPHIQFPGAWGGANWGSTAGDPQTGMVYVRSLEMISYRKMSLVEPSRGGGAGGGGRGQGTPLAPREQEGQNVYMQRCASCHGPGQMPMRSLTLLSSEGFRSIVRKGVNSMPPFPESVISNNQLDTLESYLTTLPTSDEQAGNPSEIRLPQNPNRYQGPPTRYGGSFSAGWYTSNGYPVTGPPWSQLVAYDLNTGTIKWRVADGTAPGVVGKVKEPTGTVRPRNGPVVTAGGLVFLANSQDRFVRAFDKETGRLVWEHELEANPEGVPAVYQVNGRQYIAFAAGASWGTGGDPVWRNPLHRKEGKIEAQGYHIFALPEKR